MSGRGGRAQELALAFALEIAGRTGVTGLFAGTDGSDGPTEAAGAVVDASIARRSGARAALEHNDSNPFLAAAGALLVTGPTDTNVADVALILTRGGIG